MYFKIQHPDDADLNTNVHFSDDEVITTSKVLSDMIEDLGEMNEIFIPLQERYSHILM